MRSIKRIIDELSQKALQVSLEADSQVQVEEELVFYARLPDKQKLIDYFSAGKASQYTASYVRKDQEQWEIKSPLGNGRFRSRFEHYGDPVNGSIVSKYTFTAKMKRPEGGDVEVTDIIGAELFEAMRDMSPAGMRKERFEIPVENIPGYTWEIDVYADTDWVKIDLELPQPGETRVRMAYNGFAGVLAELDIFTDIFWNDRTEEAGAKIQELYSKYFLITKEAPAVSKEQFFTETEMRQAHYKRLAELRQELAVLKDKAYDNYLYVIGQENSIPANNPECTCNFPCDHDAYVSVPHEGLIGVPVSSVSTESKT